jgi:pimeloyl-ACP methyl ester carboxylesterase
VLLSKILIQSFAVVIAASGLARPADDAIETETLVGRDGSRIEAELRRVEVPEVRSKKESRAISLAVMRVKSVVEPAGPPVFLLAGGPGGSAIENLRKHVIGGGKFYLDLMGGDVAIDQRGVGLSAPNLDSDAKFEMPLDRPWDPKADVAAMAKVCVAEAERVRALGVDLDGYDSVESADDIDAVRRALGYEKIALFAESYGTHLACATIRRHGKVIDRAVLFGAEGPDHTNKLPSYAESGLTRLAEIVRDDPVIGDDMPDLVGTLKKVLADLEANPRVVDVDDQNVGIGAFDVRWIIANQIGLIHEGATSVPARVAEMASGDFEGIAQVILEYRRDFGVGTVMGMVVDAASGASGERRKLIESEAKSCVLADSVDWPNSALASAWKVPDLGNAYRAPLVSDVPVLFIIGELDSRTPVRNAEELMMSLPNARLLVVENAAHDVNFVQPDVRAAWSAFLRAQPVESGRVKAPPLRFEAF